MKPTNKKPKITRINKAMIRSLGGCHEAIKIFDIYAQGENNPTLNSIHKRIAEGEWGRHAESAVTWLQNSNLLDANNLHEILKTLNNRKINTSIDFWLDTLQHKNSDASRSEMLNALTRIQTYKVKYSRFTVAAIIGQFMSLIDPEKEKKSFVEIISVLDTDENKQEFILGYIVGLLTFKEISVAEATKRFLNIKRYIPDDKGAQEANYSFDSWIEHRIVSAEIDWRNALKKLGSPIFNAVNTKLKEDIITTVLANKPIGKSLLKTIEAIMGNLQKNDTGLARGLTNHVIRRNFDDAAIESLTQIKQYFGRQINMSSLNWEASCFSNKKLWSEKSVMTLKDLITEDASSFSTTFDIKRIGNLINSAYEGKNTIGEILLGVMYGDEANMRRNEIIRPEWLDRLVQKQYLTEVEKESIRNINPLLWLGLLHRDWSGGAYFSSKFNQRTAVLKLYPPKRIPTTSEMRPYHKNFYRYLRDPDCVYFMAELFRLGYELPKLTGVRLKELSRMYEGRHFWADDIRKNLKVMKHLLNKLPVNKNSVFPIKELFGYRSSSEGYFLIMALDIMLNRGLSIEKQNCDKYSRALTELIRKGYLRFWRHFEKFPQNKLAVGTLNIISHYDQRIIKNSNGRKLVNIIGDLIKAGAYKSNDSLLRAYVYMGAVGAISDNIGVKKFGVKYLVKKSSYTRDILSWRRHAKSAKLDLSEYVEDILWQFSETRAPLKQEKEVVLCIEDILQELLDKESKLIKKLGHRICMCWRRINESPRNMPKNQKLWFRLAEHEKDLATYDILKYLTKAQRKKIKAKWELDKSDNKLMTFSEQIKKDYSRI